MPKDPVELELVSTIVLEKILGSNDAKSRDEIRRLATGKKDGVLARETATGHFRIVSQGEAKRRVESGDRQPALRQARITQKPAAETVRQSADELSLVSTQVLRKVLNLEEPVKEEKPAAGIIRKDKHGGFDPYNNS
jgi:hypothetical protein